MHTSLRLLALVCVGIALAYVSASVIGWLAAITWDREAILQVSNNAVLGFAVTTIAMAALPVALLALTAGALLSHKVRVHRTVQLLLVSVPWFVALVLPPTGIANPSAWLAQFFTNPHMLTVLAALPTGYLLGAAISRARKRGAA